MNSSEREIAVSRLQESCYFPLASRPTPDSTLAILQHIANLEELAPFRAFVVGSLLYAPASSRDIDILLTSCERSVKPSVESVERALCRCIAVGRSVAGVLVDPVYRPGMPETRLEGLLPPSTLLVSQKLENPGISFRIAAGMGRQYLEIGQVSVIETVRADKCHFYRKLPFDHESRGRWLAPAVPLARFVRLLGGAFDCWPAPTDWRSDIS